MKAASISRIWLRARQSAVNLWRDHSGIAATEFAVIVPLMLVMFFGTIEVSTGVALDRKATLVARTLSDLTSQSPAQPLTDTYLTNVFTASISILYPYATTPINARISQIYVDSTQTAWIQWSKAATVSSSTATQATLTASSRTLGDNVTTLVPSALLVKQSFLILSEVNYLYTPTIGYVMKSAVTLADSAYTRPRQFACLSYNSYPVISGTPPTCPMPLTGY
jgi:Flp pilus assembly protein TadG